MKKNPNVFKGREGKEEEEEKKKKNNNVNNKNNNNNNKMKQTKFQVFKDRTIIVSFSLDSLLHIAFIKAL